MYIPISTVGDLVSKWTPDPHPSPGWRVASNVAHFLRPTEHFSPAHTSWQSDLGASHTWNQYSLQETFPEEVFDLCNIKERLRESRQLISTYGLKVICKIYEREETEWTQPPETTGSLFILILIFMSYLF